MHAPAAHVPSHGRRRLQIARRSRAARRSSVRSLLLSSFLLLGVTGLALVGTGATYALWNGSATVNASTVTSGTTSLTVNEGSTFEIPATTLASLSPGQTGTELPLRLANVGTTKLTASVAGVTIVNDPNGLAGALSVSVTDCRMNPLAATQPLRTFTYTESYVLLPDTPERKTVYTVCLLVSMNASAPQSVAGGKTAFSINIVGTQVR